MVPQGVLLSTAGLTFFALDVKSKMALSCSSPQFFFINQYFHVYPNMRMNEQFQNWIPSGVLAQLIRQCIREVHCHPRPSTGREGKTKGARTRRLSQNTQHNLGSADQKEHRDPQGNEVQDTSPTSGLNPWDRRVRPSHVAQNMQKISSMLPQAPSRVAESKEVRTQRELMFWFEMKPSAPRAAAWSAHSFPTFFP